MPDRTPDRDEAGRFTAGVGDDEILAAVEELEPAGTVEVGEEVGLARQNADYRLRRLKEEGYVDSKKIGGALAWFHVGEPEPGETAHDRREASVGPDIDEFDIESVVTDLELQGSGVALEGRREALVAILEHLRENGEARSGELKEIAENYRHGFNSTESFWSNTWRRDATDQLVEREIIESGGSSGKYYWVRGN